MGFQNCFTAAKSTKYPTKLILGYHHTLSMLLHYLGKLRNPKFALCMHVKHVSSVTFYHLSNRYQPSSTGMCPCKWWTYEHLLWTNSC